MNEVFRPAENIRINARSSYLKLNHTFRKTITGQNGLSYIGPAIWNRIPEFLKKTKNSNTFKHKISFFFYFAALLLNRKNRKFVHAENIVLTIVISMFNNVNE